LDWQWAAGEIKKIQHHITSIIIPFVESFGNRVGWGKERKGKKIAKNRHLDLIKSKRVVLKIPIRKSFKICLLLKTKGKEKKNQKIVKKRHFISGRLREYAEDLVDGYEEKIPLGQETPKVRNETNRFLKGGNEYLDLNLLSWADLLLQPFLLLG
jgi:hypothetical protein